MKRRKRRARPGLDDAAYLAFVRSLPCCAPKSTDCPCYGPVQAHHLTGAGMGRKASDRETMPLCSMHHSDLHEFVGSFDDWTRAARMAFQLLAIEATQALYRARERAA